MEKGAKGLMSVSNVYFAASEKGRARDPRPLYTPRTYLNSRRALSTTVLFHSSSLTLLSTSGLAARSINRWV